MSKNLIACKLILGWLGAAWRELHPSPTDMAQDMADQCTLVEGLATIESDPQVRHYMAVSLAAYRNSDAWKQVVHSRARA